MIKKIALTLTFFVLIIVGSRAQELNCKVSLEYRKVQGTNTQIFQTLENALNEFMNGRQWTPQKYQNKEKIACSFLLTINSMESNNTFSGTLTIQARRPIYNSNYNSTLINYIDKDFNFTYTEFQPLEFNENSFTNNLTSVMAYWAYIIIGLDNDSYSSLGGTPVFELANRVVLNVQGQDISGWEANQSSGKRNRYWLTQQLLHTNYTNLRRYSYVYHRQGLDIMAEQPGRGRKIIADNIEMLKVVNERMPSSFVMQLFFDAKSDEIVNLFQPANFNEKQNVFEVLNLVDPAHLSQWQKMKN